MIPSNFPPQMVVEALKEHGSATVDGLYKVILEDREYSLPRDMAVRYLVAAHEEDPLGVLDKIEEVARRGLGKTGAYERFVKKMEVLIQKRDLEALDRLINVYSETLDHYPNPQEANTLRKLADRIAEFSSPTHSAVKELRAYADAFGLPAELMKLVAKQHSLYSKEGKNLLFTSKELAKTVVEDFRGKFYDLGIKTAEQAIQFVQIFGSDLKHLDMTSIPFTEKQLSTLLSHLPNIQTFLAPYRYLGGATMALCRAETLSHLRELDLQKCGLTGVEVQAIANSPSLSNLQNLTLGGDAIAGALSAIFNSPYLTQLKKFQFGGVSLRREDIAAIAGSKIQLKRLILYNVSIGLEEVKLLASSPSLKNNLEELALNFNPNIGHEGVQTIVSSFKNLRTLGLLDCAIDAEDAKLIAENLPQLQELDLALNSIGDEGAEAIATHLSQLQTLCLEGTSISSDGAKAIVAKLPQLMDLNLAQNRITDDGAIAIATLPNLKKLVFHTNPITEVGAEALAKRGFVGSDIYFKLT